jgi:hypothetical protein
MSQQKPRIRRCSIKRPHQGVVNCVHLKSSESTKVHVFILNLCHTKQTSLKRIEFYTPIHSVLQHLPLFLYDRYILPNQGKDRSSHFQHISRMFSRYYKAKAHSTNKYKRPYPITGGGAFRGTLITYKTTFNLKAKKTAPISDLAHPKAPPEASPFVRAMISQPRTSPARAL